MSSDNASPADSGPTSPGIPADPARNVAVDYIKARYEGGHTPKDSANAAINVPKVFREPKKLDFQWDKIVDENTKKETGLPAGFKEQDLLQMVFTCMGVDTKSQYLSALESQQPTAKDERSVAEIESLPEITKSVRKMFESGQVPSAAERSAADTAEEIQRGSAKSLLNQWTLIGTDGSSTISSGPPAMKPTYELAPGSGVFENQPATLDGVVRASDQADEQVIQRGMTRSLLGQWNTLGTTQQQQQPTRNGPVRVKATYESAPGSGVFENEPTQREGVVREGDTPGEGEQIQRGFTRSLLTQWQNKGSEEKQNYPSKRPIRIAEAEGRIAENEPVRRTDVVRADDATEGEVVKKGLAKSLANEWKTKGSEEFVSQRKAINVAEGEGTVAESEPVRRSDVVREDDPGLGDEEQIQRGTTKHLLDQWKTIGSNSRQYSSKERTPIVLAEADGKVVENEPAARRADIAREDDSGFGEVEQIQRGMARSLMNQWKNIGSVDSSSSGGFKERTPINVNEDDGRILENEPVRRTDVVRADDEPTDEVKIQRGTTRNLLSQWKNKPNEEFRSARKSIILNEDEGRIAENEPEARRSDLVREDTVKGEQVQKGMAKSLLNQWQNKATEEFKVERKPIVLAEAEGCVAENEPAQRSDVVREEIDQPVEQVQRGFTKSLLSQWKSIGSEDYKPPKRTIVLAEADDSVAENDPVRRTDVVHADDAVLGDVAQVKRGTTKSLLNQWKTKGTEEVRIERKPIIVAEDDGRVIESEPVRRENVVREDDGSEADAVVVQRGTTRSLLEQWKNKPNEEPHIERHAIVLAEAEGSVSESTPTPQRDDVVRSADYVPDERVVERGFARNLREQWKNKGSEEFRKERTPIQLYEAEGRIAENEPVRRTDVVHGGDDADAFNQAEPQIQKVQDEGSVSQNEPVRRQDVVREDDPAFQTATELPQRGQARQLRAQWTSMGSASSPASQSRDGTPKPPIQLYDESAVAGGGSGVVENQPAPRRTDVVREDDDTGDEVVLKQRGLARNMVGYWASGAAGDDAQPKMTRERMELEALRQSGSLGSGTDAAGAVFENEPVRLDGVVRADDPVDERAGIERGVARQLATSWANRRDEPASRQPFRLEMDVDPTAVSVYENQPAELQGVVRCSEQIPDVLGLHGQIRNIAQKYALATVEEEGAASARRPPDMIQIDLAEGPSVLENQPAPVDPSVVRSDDYQPDELRAGLTRNMLEKWKTQKDLEGATGAVPGFGSKPAWQLELEMTPAGSGVFENDPVVRTDVIREEDRDPDMIPVRQTRRTRALWSRRERDEIEGPQQVDTRTREMIRFTPPRERTPPAAGFDEPFKSVQRITLQSSGSSTPVRSQTPARGATPAAASSSGPASRSGVSTGSVHQSPQQSQPGTPGTAFSSSSQLSWTPLPAGEAAKARAQITNEVMEWHAKKMSRSVSVEDGFASTAAAAVTSQPSTPSVDPRAGDWMYQQLKSQLPPQQEQQPRQQQQQQQYEQPVPTDDTQYQQQTSQPQPPQPQMSERRRRREMALQQQQQQHATQQQYENYSGYGDQQQCKERTPTNGDRYAAAADQYQQLNQPYQQPEQYYDQYHGQHNGDQHQQQQQYLDGDNRRYFHQDMSYDNAGNFHDPTAYNYETTADPASYWNHHQQQQQQQHESAYYQHQDADGSWPSYQEHANYDAYHGSSTEQPMSPIDDVEQPMTVKSSATVVFRPSTNGV